MNFCAANVIINPSDAEQKIPFPLKTHATYMKPNSTFPLS